MSKFVNVNLKRFTNLNQSLDNMLNGNATNDETLEELRKEAKEIFEFDENGKIKLRRKGKFFVPHFNKLYVLFNLKKVFAFFGALTQFVFDALSSEETMNNFSKLAKQNVQALKMDAATAEKDEKEDPVNEHLKPYVEQFTKKKGVRPATKKKTPAKKKAATKPPAKPSGDDTEKK